jgi:hypothetical protein
MLRSSLGAVVALLLLASPSIAGAQEEHGVGKKGNIIISADRLFTLFAYTAVTVDTQTTKTASFSLLGSGNFDSFGGNFYNIPRLGFDYTVVDRLTIGGDALAYFTVGGTGPKVTMFGISPRVGYVLPLGSAVSLWPRAGVTYDSVSYANNDNYGNSSPTTQLAADLEALFVISPVEHAALTLGPVVDIPITGKTQTFYHTGVGDMAGSTDQSQFHVGVSAGLLFWL